MSKAAASFTIDFDTVPPHLLRAVAENQNAVVVTFDEPMVRSSTSSAASATPCARR